MLFEEWRKKMFTTIDVSDGPQQEKVGELFLKRIPVVINVKRDGDKEAQIKTADIKELKAPSGPKNIIIIKILFKGEFTPYEGNYNLENGKGTLNPVFKPTDN